MKLVKLTKKRDIIYNNKEPLNEVYSNSIITVSKLKIENRLIPTETGELNYLITLKENPAKYIILYCFMEEPNSIFRFSYFINNEIKIENKQIVKSDEVLIDEELAFFYVMDFVSNYLSANYTII